MLSEMMKTAEQIWKADGHIPGTINSKVVRAMATKLFDGVQEGYGVQLLDIAPTHEDYETLQALKTHTWQFAGAKNYNDLRAMGQLMLNDNGTLRTKSEFIQAALKRNKKALRTHLTAEYNLAVTGGQMTSKWQDIERDSELFPFLEFDAVLDEQTTGICRPLNGTVLRYDHPFWDTYYPPNHYNCRSTVRKLTRGPETKNVPTAKTPKLFQTNLGKQSLIYPKDHPYWKDIPADVATDTKRLIPNI